MKKLILLILLLSIVQTNSWGQGVEEVSEGELLGQWSDVNLVGSFAHNNIYNEVWGLEVNGFEFAVIGTTEGTHFIDVTDPTMPMEKFFVAGAVQGGQVIHRDYHDHQGYLYAVCDEGSSTLQIINISMLPDTVIVEYESNELIRRSHNIFIDANTNRLYSCAHNGFQTGSSALHIFDISDPIAPVDLGGTNNFEGYTISHVHDAYVENNIAYLNCGTNGFVVADMTDESDIKLLGLLERDDYPQSGYNHSGWPAEHGGIYYMADETHNMMMKVVNVNDFQDLQIEELIDAGNDSPFSIPHNQVVAGDFLYCSYYYDGLQVYDISDPTHPIRVMQFPTSEIEPRAKYEGAWGVYPFLPSGNILVSDMQEGLFVIEAPKLNTNTIEIKTDKLQTFPNPANDILYVTTTAAGPYNYIIQDMQGRYMSGGHLKQATDGISLKSIPSGTYFIKLVSEQAQYAALFIVSR